MAVTRTTTNETLKNDMWRACDILRRDNNVGGVMEYTEHLAWLLFLKFLDVEEKRRGDLALLGTQIHEPVLQGDLAWDAWAGSNKLINWKAEELIAFVRGRLLPSLANLNGSPLARTIAGIFSDESVGDMNVVRSVPVCASGYNLKDVLEIINRIHFDRDSDVFTITQFYEDLLERMGSENRSAGEFHTPRPVIRFMVDVIAPQIGETVYDPAYGSAGFLAQAFVFMERQAQTIEQHRILQESTFYGLEKKGLAALLGTMNMVLHGVASPQLMRGNTLEEDVKGAVEGRRDVITTNPPFGGTEGSHIQQNFPIRANATELLFLQHIIKKLKRTPNARAALVIPEGTLFRGGAFADVKRDLLEQFHLFAVVSLPPGTFAPYSDVKTALLFFKRPDEVLEHNPQARHETWYYELPLPDGLKKFSKGNRISDEHFAEARVFWQCWQQYLKGQVEHPFAYAADLREQWLVHRQWETHRKPGNSQIDSPQTGPGESRAIPMAQAASGPRPQQPYHTWIETLESLKARSYDLSARNPNQMDRREIQSPLDLTASLLESTEELHQRLLRLQEKLRHSPNGNGTSNGTSTGA